MSKTDKIEYSIVLIIYILGLIYSIYSIPTEETSYTELYHFLMKK